MLRLLAMVFLAVVAHGAWAAEAVPAATDPQIERRVMALAEELRCLVCQNQSLADSHAPLAIDLKNQVRDKLRQGMSERQIVEYMVERYGDFVRYRPPVKATTLLLWFGPLLLLVSGVGALYYRLACSRVEMPLALTEGERKQAAELLGTANQEREA